ncbi:MAG TPA: cbb3-type cytochrome c oxidase N-terminal domain-containing protein, partial [Myxococcota bacterium]|nr:cbb3-type cytochrome c oxidase N-terminal domain-containing protein [Myxococcota bacterium]
MSRNTDIERGHRSEFDGIEEYDNPLPDWWVGLFLVTVIWGVGYAVKFHFISHDSQAGWYQQELADAKARWPDLDKPAGLDESPETLALGKETFDSTCASCHNNALTGGIGPNLIDDRWIHGGKFEDLTKTITDGVAAKGMPTWGPILGPKKVAAVASFILSKNEGEAGRARGTALGAYAE